MPVMFDWALTPVAKLMPSATNSALRFIPLRKLDVTNVGIPWCVDGERAIGPSRNTGTGGTTGVKVSLTARDSYMTTKKRPISRPAFRSATWLTISVSTERRQAPLHDRVPEDAEHQQQHR